MALKESAHFFSQFLSKPRAVGALSPSSPSLARKMVEGIDWSEVHAVVEYGPGTGAFTAAVLSRMYPGTKFLAIEINPIFVRMLSRRYPEIRVYEDSVSNVRKICDQEQIDHVDVIVSALPWASFSREDQLELLKATLAVLKPGGQFVTCAYLQGVLLPAGQRFSRQLRQHFAHVEMSKPAWANLPPAFVYRCRT